MLHSQAIEFDGMTLFDLDDRVSISTTGRRSSLTTFPLNAETFVKSEKEIDQELKQLRIELIVARRDADEKHLAWEDSLQKTRYATRSVRKARWLLYRNIVAHRVSPVLEGIPLWPPYVVLLIFSLSVLIVGFSASALFDDWIVVNLLGCLSVVFACIPVFIVLVVADIKKLGKMATCSRLDELRTAHRTSIWNKKNARDESSKRQSVCFSLRKSLESLRKQETELTRLRCELVNQELDALLKTDWRYLQGIDWEQFLFRIFHEHGYKVEGTKIVGDQGVDLIVKSHGKVLAVQAKGYAGSVGNSAVQEVVTGKLHYGATHCAVICNSAFTKSAEQLSRTTGCIMIDGAGIPNLIKNGMAILNSN